jgi:hypothetical protein
MSLKPLALISSVKLVSSALANLSRTPNVLFGRRSIKWYVLSQAMLFKSLTLCSARRTTAVVVITAMQTVVMITTTHNSHRLHRTATEWAALQLRNLLHLQQTLQAVQLLTLMPYMVVTRTISPCGMLRSPNNSRKGNRPNLDLRLSRALSDVTHVTETSSIDACLLA